MDDSQNVFLALDQGTHSSRAIVFDSQAKSLANFQVPVDITYPDHVSAEQDASEILQSVNSCLQQAIRAANQNHWNIVAAGLATQRSSVVAWNRRTGEPLSPVISWQDRRAHEKIDQLSEHASEIRGRTGLPLTPHYGASKIRWLLEQNQSVQQCKRKEQGIGPLASFLIAELTRCDEKPLSCYVVDHTNALRTQLMNLQELNWDQRLIELFGIPNVTLPQCVPVIHDFGNLSGTTIPLTAVSGDQTAALFSQGPFPDKTALVNLGTGGFVLMPSADNADGGQIDDELLGGLSLSDDASCEYLCEGTVNGCGAAMKWASEALGLSEADSENSQESCLEKWLHEYSQPPIFVNLVGGVGSPWWIDQGESFWCDHQGHPIDPHSISSGVSRQAAMVAVVESIVFLIYENLRRIARHQTITDLRISGGLSQFDGVCHRLANLSRCCVTRSVDVEATASGVAWMSAGRPQRWQASDDDTLFVPSVDDDLTNRYDVLRSQLKRLRG